MFFATLGAAINLALNKPASQSGTYAFGSVTYPATRAVDGNESTKSCTLAQVHPWWAVDLGDGRPDVGHRLTVANGGYDIGHVTVTNDVTSELS